jgi:hypothetical protein
METTEDEFKKGAILADRTAAYTFRTECAHQVWMLYHLLSEQFQCGHALQRTVRRGGIAEILKLEARNSLLVMREQK